MKTKLLLLFLTVSLGFAHAQSNPAVNSYQLLVGKNGDYQPFIQYKSYYLLTLLQELPGLRKAITNDEVFAALLKSKVGKASVALKSCGKSTVCFAEAMIFSEAEIKKVSDRLTILYKMENAFGKVVSQHLLPSGCYGTHSNLTPQDFLAKAWEQDASAINHTINVYIAGKKPNYPKVDSISFAAKDKEFPELVAARIDLEIEEDNSLFFEPSLNFALSALELNGRAEAADYEPMGEGVNKSAVSQIKKTNFSNYKYSVILVPGAGPENPAVELSAGGMTRCRIAAAQYQKGLAPFIVVSGGRVHPYKTKYSEAYEMKKFMVNILHIPESAIIMEPHARHTTTNFRNCARLIFRYGIPMEKPAIVSTTKSSIPYIMNVLPERCKKELGYYPYKTGAIISDTTAEFYPNELSLQIDFDEPLDPK